MSVPREDECIEPVEKHLLDPARVIRLAIGSFLEDFKDGMRE